MKDNVGVIPQVMTVLLIQAGTIDVAWLKQYMEQYDPNVLVYSASTMAEAETILKDNHVDVILLDGGVTDVMSPTGIEGVVFTKPTVPIVIMTTGKVLRYECARTPNTWVYHLKTDVTRETFLNHLRQIVTENKSELARNKK